MLRTLAVAANKRCIQQQLYQRLLSSMRSQSVAMSTRSKDNPQNLPHLPVPELNQTFEKYIKSVKPLLTPQELCVTEKLIKEFSKSDGVGCKLQKFLLDRAKCTTNWLEEWWLNVAYLGFRQPVVVYSSPGQLFPLQDFKCDEERLSYTAKLIMAAASYKSLIDSKKIPMDKMGKDELDMNQYNKIFGTCRIPAKPLDCLKFYGNSKHIAVVHNNHFFKLDLYNQGKLLSEKQLVQQLANIIKRSKKRGPAIGVLSSDNRDIWADSYALLVDDKCNRAAVTEIQKSLFLVCLDGSVSKTGCENRQTFAGKQLIHGGGSCANSGNRWFDKTVQFVIGEDGIVGLTYEHSPSEGQPIAVMVDYLVNFIKKDGGKDVPDVDCVQEPDLLQFNVGNDLECAIKISNENIDKLIKNLELSCFTFDKYGKEFVKSQKFSPDSFIQIAIQYSFYRLHEKPGAHYESAATRKYVGGRTETIRSCSQESIKFAKAMLDDCKKAGEKVEAMKAAINGHKKYTVEAVNGFGVDRHLLGLKLAAKELSVKLPDLYNDPSYLRSTHFRISTSQVATKCKAFMCYGPTADDGYGCCYNPRNDDMDFAVSAFNSYPKTSAKKFHKALYDSLCDMEEVLLKGQKAKL